MTQHIAHGDLSDRDEYLVDGCPRCDQYVAELGIHFDAERFRSFWGKMVEVEFDSKGGYASTNDKVLGRRLYTLALSLQRAFGLDPHTMVCMTEGGVPMMWLVTEDSRTEVTDPRD